MKYLRTLCRILLATICLLSCSGSGGDPPASQEESAEGAAVFEDGFEDGDTSEWQGQEGSEDEEGDDEDEKSGE